MGGIPKEIELYCDVCSKKCDELYSGFAIKNDYKTIDCCRHCYENTYDYLYTVGGGLGRFYFWELSRRRAKRRLENKDYL